MKRIIPLLIALLLLLSGTAAAERVMVPVWQSATDGDVAMEIYESALGFSIAYDPDHFVPGADALDTLTFTDYPGAFLAFQSMTDWTTDDLAAGLALQSGAGDCTVDTATVGGVFGDAMEATTVVYEEDVDGVSYQHVFLLLPREADVLMVECYYPVALDDKVSAELAAMLRTLELFRYSSYTSTPSAEQPTGSRLVQCEVCGGWFTEGNEFRNHICKAETYPSEGGQAEANMVQCEVCGGWFAEGNEFRNHICVAETYPDDESVIEAYPEE